MNRTGILSRHFKKKMPWITVHNDRNFCRNIDFYGIDIIENLKKIFFLIYSAFSSFKYIAELYILNMKNNKEFSASEKNLFSDTCKKYDVFTCENISLEYHLFYLLWLQ